MKNKRNGPSGKWKTALIYLELIVMAVIIIYPVIWIIGSSFGSSKGLANATAIPANPTFNNYKDLLTNTKFPIWYMNTLKVAFANMVCGVLLSTLGAYAFSRFKFKGKKASLLSILILQMFPTFLTAIAVYMLFLNFGLLNSLTGLIVVGVAAQLPYNLWLLKGYLDGIPSSFDEAALIDGASRTQIFARIILPLASPMLTFVAVTQFAAPWMDFILPKLLISSEEKKTVAIGLFSMISDETRNEFTLFAAGAVLVAVPIAILYIALQKYLINGLTAGGDKG
ncbi:sugar ABC transporter permease [Paenibacillus antibioticophila]|uniref:Sugar ABC transporter permease n=1 Tax=Paenibacillus antibioticophila TaxID=1274374 RepID=A0A920CGC1_9BACL|nr:sugar ABC transporter permease [Paenibacillus antibioticophila]GIO36643.1 sugar ABC transporter permease [Paenibacillus antibioticophila]